MTQPFISKAVNLTHHFTRVRVSSVLTKHCTEERHRRQYNTQRRPLGPQRQRRVTAVVVAVASLRVSAVVAVFVTPFILVEGGSPFPDTES